MANAKPVFLLVLVACDFPGHWTYCEENTGGVSTWSWTVRCTQAGEGRDDEAGCDLCIVNGSWAGFGLL
jgi:hypothetical protein